MWLVQHNVITICALIEKVRERSPGPPYSSDTILGAGDKHLPQVEHLDLSITGARSQDSCLLAKAPASCILL